MKISDRTTSDKISALLSEFSAADASFMPKLVVLSSYCSHEELRKMRFRDGKYSPDGLNRLLSAMVDACSGLLSSIMQENEASSD